MIFNYRIEKVANGYVLHCSSGKDGPVTKYVFIGLAALIAHLENVLK